MDQSKTSLWHTHVCTHIHAGLCYVTVARKPIKRSWKIQWPLSGFSGLLHQNIKNKLNEDELCTSWSAFVRVCLWSDEGDDQLYIAPCLQQVRQGKKIMTINVTLFFSHETTDHQLWNEIGLWYYLAQKILGVCQQPVIDIPNSVSTSKLPMISL